MDEARAPLGVVISILSSAGPNIWSNVEHTLHVLEPQWSSLAVDVWDRRPNASVTDEQIRVHAAYPTVLARFSRVLFLATTRRDDVPSHVRPSFSYRLHWHAAFADPIVRAAKGPHSEGLPEVLAGIDADVYVPEGLPIGQLARVLGAAAARSSTAATPAYIDRLERAARSVWVDGVKPNCTKLTANFWLHGKKQKKNFWLDAHVRSDASVDRITTASASDVGDAVESGLDGPHRQQCELISAYHRPLFVSPRELWRLKAERDRSWVELERFFLPSQLGSCCGRQNIFAARPLLAATGAKAVLLSRGPWCPPSTFFMFHRTSLPRFLSSLRLWQQAYDRAALFRDRRYYRWEFVTCSLLAPNEAILLAYYNSSALETQARAARSWSPPASPLAASRAAQQKKIGHSARPRAHGDGKPNKATRRSPNFWDI